MIKKSLYRFYINLFLTLCVLGQIGFYFYSPTFTQPVYEARLFTTTGILFEDGKDLHWLNESAHYFSETIIGWARFPHFKDELVAFAGLPTDSQLSIYKQERQNMITSLRSSMPISDDQMHLVRTFIQSKMDEYNTASRTSYRLVGEDIDHLIQKQSYATGALFALAISFVLTILVWFVRREFRV
ncbi:hypothetical protein IPJ72_03065 [Candidatus Peregrinibacteria bacterium]|nr:MAG: hypothetical protein IPJ72_03065 [Candidatus Peregrinibacteria bacterium]